MTLTQARIGAAEILDRIERYLGDRKIPRQNIITHVQQAKAALTAAAEVGEPKSKKKRWGFAGAIDDKMAEVEAATIERCAQVAENWSTLESDGEPIAAAIRALKEEG